MDCGGVETGSLGVESQNFVFGLEEKVAVGWRVEFAEGEGYDSSPGESVLVTVLSSLVLFYILHLQYPY